MTKDEKPDLDEYFRGSEGLRRLKKYMEVLTHLDEGITRIQMFDDKRSRWLSPEDRVAIAEHAIQLEEIYWRYFHIFIDRIKAYIKYVA